MNAIVLLTKQGGEKTRAEWPGWIDAGDLLREGTDIMGMAYRSIAIGVEQLATGDVARHLHYEGYVNIVLAGRFTEAAFAGRAEAEPGMALVHGPFDCHANISGAARGPKILRLPWRSGAREGAYRVSDPDLLVRLAERDPIAAECAFAEMIRPAPAGDGAWVDELADALRSDRVDSLGSWAEAHRLSASSLSRGFREAYHVSPQRFRAQVRARVAWRRIVSETTPLTGIAHECDFADLAHMSRGVRELTGRWPSAWRNGMAKTEKTSIRGY